MLRRYFLYHRRLLGRPCRGAWHTARETIAAPSPGGGEIRSGMIAVVQTAGCDLGWHPHVHGLAARSQQPPGTVTPYPEPSMDLDSASDGTIIGAGEKK